MESTALEEVSRQEQSTLVQGCSANTMASLANRWEELFKLIDDTMKLEKAVLKQKLVIIENQLEIEKLRSLRNRNPLLEHLEGASTMTKQEIAPLMKYIQGILDTRKRFRHPSSAKKQVEESGPASFTLFPTLPIELQRLVWKHSTSEARIFEVRAGSVNYLSRTLDAKAAHQSVLNIALSCKAAYAFVLEHFDKVKLINLCCFPAVPETSSGFGKQIYLVNWDRDIFYAPDGNMEDFFSTQHQDPLGNDNEYLVKVKNVALHFEYVCRSTSSDRFISANMPKIKQIIYVADCERRLDAARIELEESRGVEYPLRMGLPGYEEILDGPLIRTYVGDEMDHPYRQILQDEFMDLSILFATPEVRRAYKGIKVSFELWRRPAK